MECFFFFPLLHVCPLVVAFSAMRNALASTFAIMLTTQPDTYANQMASIFLALAVTDGNPRLWSANWRICVCLSVNCRRTVVCPIIDVISDDTFEYMAGSDMTYGGFNWKLNFRWYPVPQREMDRRKGDRTLPVRWVTARVTLKLDKFDCSILTSDWPWPLSWVSWKSVRQKGI